MMKHTFKVSLISLAVAAACMSSGMVQASERESLEQLRATTLSLINALVEQGVLDKTKAEALIKQAESAKPAPASAAADAQDAADGDEKVVRVQYVPEHVKKQLREEIKQEVMAKAQSEGWAYPGSIPEWLNRIEWEGDLRLRYEKDMYPEGNETPTNLGLEGIDNVNDTSQDRDRWRIRARLGAKLHINDTLTGGIRLTTGSVADPVSPNQTFGDTYTGSSKFSFALDRAYLKYAPTSWLTLSGGRIENPWMNTDLVWDPDLAFDGGVAALRPKINDTLTGFLTAGAFPIQENSETFKDSSGNSISNGAKDKWLYGIQAGLDWSANSNTNVKLGLAYYDFTNVQGIANPVGLNKYDKTGRQFHQKGNTVYDINSNNLGLGQSTIWGLASKFQEVNLTGSIDWAAFSPTHVVLTGDYVKNVGFDRNEVQALVDSTAGSSPVGGDTAWMLKLLVGTPETVKARDWNVFAAYKRLETNSVLDAYTDSDFHLGGTNAKGYIVGANYGVDKNAWLSLRWFSADQIVGSPLSIDVLMVDLNAKF